MKVKAFTLVECLIAMFILGISSLLLCQGYTQLMRLTNKTNTINTSIGQQRANAELAAGTADSNSKLLRKDDKVKVQLTVIGIDSNTDDTKKEVMNYSSREKRKFTGDFTKGYEGKMNVYEVTAYGYDAQGKGSNDIGEDDKDGADVRFIYFGK